TASAVYRRDEGAPSSSSSPRYVDSEVKFAKIFASGSWETSNSSPTDGLYEPKSITRRLPTSSSTSETSASTSTTFPSVVAPPAVTLLGPLPASSLQPASPASKPTAIASAAARQL